jgi:DnaJ-class molecular chaperone
VAAGRKDYYRLLGVDRRADERTIKSAYRRLALKYHPDVARGERAADRFREIHEAYTVLSNPEQRARYDPIWAVGRDRARASPKRADRGSKGTVRSYSVGLGGLGIRLDFGWRV